MKISNGMCEMQSKGSKKAIKKCNPIECGNRRVTEKHEIAQKLVMICIIYANTRNPFLYLHLP